MASAFHLSLGIGPAAPIPVSRDVLDAVTAVQVTHASQGPNAFQITFDLSTRSPLHTLFLLSGGSSLPLVRVQIVVTVKGTPEVLMDGVMTNHQVSSGSDAAHATLTVTGEDLSRVMDYIDFSGVPYPAMPPEVRVLLILAKYAVFGVVPMVIPSVLVDVPIPTDRIPIQQGKDLAYIRRLADDEAFADVAVDVADGDDFAFRVGQKGVRIGDRNAAAADQPDPNAVAGRCRPGAGRQHRCGE